MDRQDRRKTKRWTAARRCVQAFMLVVFCLPLLIAGWGLLGGFSGGEEAVPTPADGVFYGSLSASQLGGVSILDPFATLEAAAAAKTFGLGMLAGMLPALVVYGIVRGRAFCGWVCPVNLLCEGVDWLRGKLRLNVAERALPRRAKVGVAAAVLVLSALFGIPVFEAFSPIGAINKGMLFGSLAGSFTLLAIAVAELFWARRVWCRAICPLGGFYEVVGKAGLVNVKMDFGKCIHCDACKDACLADPVILDAVLAGEDVMIRAGDCMACGECVDACPTDALRMGLGRFRNVLKAGGAKAQAEP